MNSHHFENIKRAAGRAFDLALRFRDVAFAVKDAFPPKPYEDQALVDTKEAQRVFESEMLKTFVVNNMEAFTDFVFTSVVKAQTQHSEYWVKREFRETLHKFLEDPHKVLADTPAFFAKEEEPAPKRNAGHSGDFGQ